MSEWLRRQTWNLLGFARAGSIPAVDVFGGVFWWYKWQFYFIFGMVKLCFRTSKSDLLNSLSQKEKEKKIFKGSFGYSWKLKLKIEKYCSKIILKCVNSTVGPIFNEKVTKKWNLWIHKQYIMYCLRQKRDRKSVV